MSDRFDELVDHPALRAEERERLRRVHDLLLEVGPPPEAPPRLRDASPATPGEIVPLRPLRRGVTLLAAALGLAAAAGVGYFAGERGTDEPTAEPVTATVTTTRVTTAPAPTTPQPQRGPLVTMTGVGEARDASATVEILPRASSGDYPVRIQVRGLAAGETFELWVVKDGELEQLCGRFTTSEGLTDAVVAVPYEMRTRDEWVVVRPGTTEPLLRT